jgi:hypothetical protein
MVFGNDLRKKKKFSSQVFSIASLFLPIFPMVDFATPNCTVIAR